MPHSPDTPPLPMREADIRPPDIFDEFLRLCAEDVRTYFADAPRVVTACPACDGPGQPAFTKEGFGYAECPACRTLFVTPRPPADAFSRYYTESASSKYWATTFYAATAAARRESLWKPKARLVRDAMVRHGAGSHAVVDVGGGFGLFAEEMTALLGETVTVIEPAPHLAAACRGRGIPVVERFLEDVRSEELPDRDRTFVSFELFEHLHNPGSFLDRMRGLMRAGELFIFTTLSGAGADIRALWEDSKAVSPPHHLNFLNPTAVTHLLTRRGFEVLDVSTPGRLDIDILANNRERIKDRFWQVFLEQATSEQRAGMQALLATTGFSSHMMAICRRAS